MSDRKEGITTSVKNKNKRRMKLNSNLRNEFFQRLCIQVNYLVTARIYNPPDNNLNHIFKKFLEYGIKSS